MPRSIMPILVSLAALPPLAGGCGACGGSQSSSDADADAAPDACTYSSCDRECRATRGCYESCSSGRCYCTHVGCDPETDGGEDGDGDARDADADADADDGRDGDVFEVFDGLETRAGCTPGVVCTLIPGPPGDIVAGQDGEGAMAVFTGGGDDPLVWPLWGFDRSTGRLMILDGFEELTGHGFVAGQSTAVDGRWIAYSVRYPLPAPDTRVESQLRLLDTETGEIRVLATNRGEPGRTSIGGESLDYPWVLWADTSEFHTYAWFEYAMNIETGEKINLPPIEAGAMGGRLLGTTAVVARPGPDGEPDFDIYEYDLAAGASYRIIVDNHADQWNPAITADWIAWIDQRDYWPEGNPWSPVSANVWGMDRRTGEERRLSSRFGLHQVLRGEGDWLAWEDHSDEGVEGGVDINGERNVYAMHLPTMTEMCVVNWPGAQSWPKVYENHVLLINELGYYGPTELWDCELPVPSELPSCDPDTEAWRCDGSVLLHCSAHTGLMAPYKDCATDGLDPVCVDSGGGLAGCSYEGGTACDPMAFPISWCDGSFIVDCGWESHRTHRSLRCSRACVEEPEFARCES